MNRRRFIAMVGMAPVVVAAAARFEALRAAEQITFSGSLTQTLEFTAQGEFKPGDTVTITGCKWAGTYRMTDDRVFVLSRLAERSRV